MRSLFLIAAINLMCAGIIAGQCQAEPKLVETGKVLKDLSFYQKKTSEIGLSITASVDGASWQTPGAEAAVITVFVNKKYNQDVILFAGSERFEYKIILGEMGVGRHSIDLVLNEERSAKGVRNTSITSAKTFRVGARQTDDLNGLAVANSPLIYVRPNAVDKFSDIPLVTYYEIFPESATTGKIRYTTIFSNEDGGTQTAALMARWGRATDIEWVYEFSYRDGRIVSEIYQGANHKTVDFRGERSFGRHPRLLTATENNNFADSGCSALRIANVPYLADLTSRSRESIMDENSWTYRIMAQEAIREGRVDAANMGANVIDDPRNYLYVEIDSRIQEAAVSVEVVTADGAKSSSDLGDGRLRVARSGFQRIAVRIPSRSVRPSSVALKCYSLLSSGTNDGICTDASIARVLLLDQNFRVKELELSDSQRRTLRPGESVVSRILP